MRMASTELASSATNETDASQTVGWRYPPFLIAKYGQTGPKDMVNLTEISIKSAFLERAFPTMTGLSRLLPHLCFRERIGR
jgi:hypothetical protein